MKSAQDAQQSTETLQEALSRGSHSKMSTAKSSCSQMYLRGLVFRIWILGQMLSPCVPSVRQLSHMIHVNCCLFKRQPHGNAFRLDVERSGFRHSKTSDKVWQAGEKTFERDAWHMVHDKVI